MAVRAASRPDVHVVVLVVVGLEAIFGTYGLWMVIVGGASDGIGVTRIVCPWILTRARLIQRQLSISYVLNVNLTL
jgi:hypothetical protein